MGTENSIVAQKAVTDVDNIADTWVKQSGRNSFLL